MNGLICNNNNSSNSTNNVHRSIDIDDQHEIIPRLQDYQVSSQFGFMVENPLIDLPAYYAPWMDIANNLQALITEERLRDEVHQMPLLDHTKLVEAKEWNLAHVVLSFISNGYVWMLGEKHVPKVLPRNLAIPYAGVCSLLDVSPSYSHLSSVLANWKLKDPTKPAELDNLETIVIMAGGADESWFFMVAGAVEIECASGLQAIVSAQHAVVDRNMNKLKLALREMDSSLQQMKRALARMHDGCDPHVFYNGLRPFLAGMDSSAFKNKGLGGLIYEGVSEEPFRYVGGSAAQSSSIPSFDAALGVEHTPQEDKLRHEFQQYMPPLHRDFINAIASGPSIRLFVQNSHNAELEEAYNQCLTALKLFRTQHVQIVARYIVIMSNKKGNNSRFANQAKAGTGGTGFMKFLKSLRDATSDSVLTPQTETDNSSNSLNGSITTMQQQE